MDKKFIKKLNDLIDNRYILENVMLSCYTTFHIGGVADCLVSPVSICELKEIIYLCKKEKVDYYIIGNGSNLLIGDKGYRGVIIRICDNLSDINIQKEKDFSIVKAGAGIRLSRLAVEVANAGLSGFEFAAGIPGTLGGAVTMNAGAYDGEIKDFILDAVVLDREGTMFHLTKEELELGYRSSIIQKKDYIVLESTFLFPAGNREEILRKITQLNKKRKEKQPLEYYSAGSTFKRPEGYFAGKLIMDAGLKGYRVGDIMVSSKHCGFVINLGKGTAEQAKRLIDHIILTVEEKYGVILEPEVRFLGEF